MKVSIIIPTINRGFCEVKQSIVSALKQTYKEKEIIVVDIQAKEKLEYLFQKYRDNIKVYTPMPNVTVASAIMEAINESNGEYIVVSEESFQNNHAIMNAVKALDLSEEKYNVITGGLKFINNKVDFLYYIFDKSKDLTLSNFLIKKNMFEKYKFEESKFIYAFSLEFIYKLFSKEKILNINTRAVEKIKKNLFVTELKNHSEYDIVIAEEIKNLKFSNVSKYFKNNTSKMIKYFKKARHEKNYLISSELAVHIALYLETISPEIANNFINKEVLFINEKSYCDIVKLRKKTDKPRLIYHSNVWIVGGIERVLNSLFEDFKKKYEIILVASNIDYEVGFALPEEVNSISLSSISDKNYYSVLTFLCRYLDCDLFVGNQNIHEYFLKVYELLYHLNIKTIAMNHGNYFFPFQFDWLKEYNKERNYYYSFCNAVTWPIEFSAKAYGSINNNGLCISNPVKSQNVDIKKTNNKEIRLLTAGRLNDPYKRLDIILMAFKKVLKEVPNAKLVCVGLVDLKVEILNTKFFTFGELLEKLDIPKENIEFVGPVPSVDEYYKNSDLFLFASESEGFGMVIAEANSYGVPAISTKLDGIEELLHDGENGYLVEKDNVDEYAEKIIKVLKDNKLRLNMSKKALEISKNFEMKEVLKKWHKLIDAIINDKEFETIKVDSTYKNCIKQYEHYITTGNIKEKKRSFLSKTIHYYEKNGFLLTIKRIFIGITNPIISRIKRSNN